MGSSWTHLRSRSTCQQITLETHSAHSRISLKKLSICGPCRCSHRPDLCSEFLCKLIRKTSVERRSHAKEATHASSRTIVNARPQCPCGKSLSRAFTYVSSEEGEEPAALLSTTSTYSSTPWSNPLVTPLNKMSLHHRRYERDSL